MAEVHPTVNMAEFVFLLLKYIMTRKTKCTKTTQPHGEYRLEYRIVHARDYSTSIVHATNTKNN